MSGETQELYLRAQRGDAAAYDQLFEREGGAVLLFIRCRMGSALAAQLDPFDVLQETYAEAHRSFDRFEAQGEGSFRRWLLGIAAHRIHDLADHFGAQKRRPPSPLVQASTALARIRAEQTSPSGAAAKQERAARLVEVLDRLDADTREAVLLRFFEGLTQAEIAARLDRSERAVRRLLGKALLELGDALEDLAP